MIASDTQHQMPYVYGEILSRSMYQAREPELPGIGRFLSQGAAGGAFVSFLFPLTIVLSQPDTWNILIIFFLPFFLAIGIIFGLFDGFLVWVCSRLARRPLNAMTRVLIGLVLLAILAGVWYVISTVSSKNQNLTFEAYLYGEIVFLTVGCALAPGSGLQPWRELVRGAKFGPRLLAGITGLLLRVVVVFFLMESILAAICVLQQPQPGELTFVMITLAHFLAASIIVFARMKFWLLVPLALVVNLPIIYAIKTEFSLVTEPVFFYISISYLALWAAFLLTRWSLTHSALAFLKEELRYYVID